MPSSRQSEPTRHDLDFFKNSGVLSAVGDHSSLGVFTVDAQGKVVCWSEGAKRITGYDAKEVVGQPCHFLEGPGCKGFRGLTNLLKTSDPRVEAIENQECNVYAKDSRELRLLGNARLLRDDEGRVYGAIGLFVDITETLRLNSNSPPAGQGFSVPGLVGESPVMIEVHRRVCLAADSEVTTLITGESGTGKEIAARAIHHLSDRSDKPFVAVNCSALSEAILESELFGHVEGAFTGAIRSRRGVFESAEGGTLFLDEIGDVSPALQVKLLRVLQEREIKRVGGDESVPVDVRLITATNRDLDQRVAEGSIRDDFYYRIRVFEVRMPPLRERVDDIPDLVYHFIERIAQEQRRPSCAIAVDALGALVQYPWPGNVRELRHAIEHAMVIQKGPNLGLLDLPDHVRGVGRTPPAGLLEPGLKAKQVAERLRIIEALDAHDWNRTRTAESLSVSRVTLWKKMRRYRIDEDVDRGGERDHVGG